ncbi:nuclear pore glycoprotein p62 [Folsomia candida]|uniref:Nuclear pore glycoprotein p62 n=1 Tax=Folsomia candida TaxID=158441 RepID=A0A226DKI4_FOLCA|nr:nuclear pore glycoprotein p62 [Folsomia candida]XP_021961115.1 nuclear pore glycoprotein p62 [Folsomia candida]OXA45743.1 Nuclear pore glycoprotein p62 [Folsomia candida]
MEMNFRELQELMNKWTIDLGEQEKQFIEQATKVNAWDKTVMANGEKIAELDATLAKVKVEDTRLCNTLEYLKSQQKDFESFLKPIEDSLPVNIAAEPEREQLFTLAENVDMELQQVAEDMKEIIRHINEANKTMDKSDPIYQILTILNEHTDALQWVEDISNDVQKELENVTRMHQLFKKDQARSLSKMFQN